MRREVQEIDEPLEDPAGAEDGAAGEAQEDDPRALLLESFEDEEVRTRVQEELDRERERARTEALEEARTALRGQGLDLGQGNRAVIADPAAFGQFAGEFVPRQQAPPAVAAAAQVAQATNPDDLGPMPDPSFEPEKFTAWLQKRDEVRDRRFEGVLQQQREQTALSQADQACERAKAILDDYGLGDLKRHPQFDAVFAEMVVKTGASVAQMRDPAFLAGVAGMVNPLLRATLPQAAAEVPRRSVDPAAGRAALSRQAAAATGASRGMPPASRTDADADEFDREGAAALGVSVAEWRGLGKETPDDYLKARKEAARQR